MPSRPAPLPNFSERLARNRKLIAKHLGLVDPIEVNAAIEDLASRLTLAWTFVRDVDRNLSVAKQRTELRRLLRVSTINLAHIDALDPAVANRIGKNLPGGTQQLLYGQPSAQEIKKAIRNALLQLPRSQRGRPVGTDRLALQQLALGLACVWAEHTGRPPTRSYDAFQGAERGRFHDFVVRIMTVIPLRLRKTLKGGTRGVDHIVRLAISEFHAAIRSGDATRGRGNIDERLWLGVTKRSAS